MELKRNRLRELRLARDPKMSQEAVARAAGLSFTTVWGIEAGKVAPSLRTAQALAEALGVSVDELFPAEEARA